MLQYALIVSLFSSSKTDDYSYDSYDEYETTQNETSTVQTKHQPSPWLVFVFKKPCKFLENFHFYQQRILVESLRQLCILGNQKFSLTTHCNKIGRSAVLTSPGSIDPFSRHCPHKRDKHNIKEKLFIPAGRLCYTHRNEELNLYVQATQHFSFQIKTNHLTVPRTLDCRSNFEFFDSKSKTYMFCGPTPEFEIIPGGSSFYISSCYVPDFRSNTPLQIDMNFQVVDRNKHAKYVQCQWSYYCRCYAAWDKNGM